ncbi:hypothetical protein TNCV_3378731 [Trichonephila clavipes]|nr:hypothetical protein TNCV_3378731 [Trichonephila clavipes]
MVINSARTTHKKSGLPTWRATNRVGDCCDNTAVGNLVVRASDSRPEGLGSMPNATKYPPSTHGVRARWISGSDVLWAESRAQGLENISLPFSSMQKLWSWRQVVSPSIVPLGNFAELNRTVTCIVLKANDRRTSSPLPR